MNIGLKQANQRERRPEREDQREKTRERRPEREEGAKR
jgi:hypothetical protein